MAENNISVSKLRDDLKASESKFNIESYLTASEASKYLSNIPGLNDIVSAITGLVDDIFEFANMILGFVEKILSFLNINNIIDALGIKSLLEFISTLISTGLGVIGLPLGQRANISKLFNAVCSPIGVALLANGYNKNALERFALLALIIGLTCTAPGQGFTNMYAIMNNTPEISEYRTQSIELAEERNVAINNPVFIFDAVANDYIVDQIATDAKVADIQTQIDEIEAKIADIELQIDTLFASLVPTIFSNTDSMVNISNEGIIKLTIEIANHNVAPIVSDSNVGLSTSIISAIDETVVSNIDDKHITSLELSSDPLYGTLENNQYPTIDTNKNYDIDDFVILTGLPNDLTASILVDSITALDPATSVVTLSSSPVIRSLARRDLEADLLSPSDIVTECPTNTITDMMRYIA